MNDKHLSTDSYHFNHRSSCKQIFITGGCGFIGANLVKYLFDRDSYNIVVYDDLSAGSEENLDRAIVNSKQNSKVVFIKGNILDKEYLEDAIKGCDSIVHLAAHTKVVESLENPCKNFEINTIGTFNVLEAARKNNIERFIFASSNAAVGEQESPINEKMIPKPISPYGASKLAGESLCSTYYHSYGIKAVSLRFSNAYGPYSEHKTSVIPKFIQRVKEGKPLEIYGDGEQTRDFVHAEDICQVIHKCLLYEISPKNRDIGGDVFQVGSGVETRIIDLVSMIQGLAKESGIEEPEIVYKDMLKGEIRRNYSDIKRIKDILGFNATGEIQTFLSKLL